MKLRLLAVALFLLGLICIGQQSSAQLTMTGVGPTAPGGGSSSAVFTFGGLLPTTGFINAPPYTVTGTFNTGSSDLSIVGVVNAVDSSAASVTSVSVAGTVLTCVQGVNNAAEQSWLCYGAAGAHPTATISIAYSGGSGVAILNIATGKVATTTPAPYSTGLSTSGQGGAVSTPFAFDPTTGSGGVPASGVGVGVIGDFFTSGSRTITSLSPIQDAIANDTTGNGQSLGLGHTTTSGASSGVTVNDSGTIFPAWAIASWSP